MIGGRLPVRAVFCAPGVAPSGPVDGAQFWPLSLLISGFCSSIDRFPPFAGVLQSHPLKVVSRTRVAQSPRLAYVTESTSSRVPATVPGFEKVIFSPPLARVAPAAHG